MLVDLKLESLDLQLFPDDRSDFDVHGALEDDKATQTIMSYSRNYCKIRFSSL